MRQAADVSDYPVTTRKSVTVTAVEQAHLLTEMNGFLNAVHGIHTALAAKDFAKVEALAKALGPKGGDHDPVGKALHEKLPNEWFALARPTHKNFLAVAQAAAMSPPSVENVVAKLGSVTQQCVSCHSAFKLEIRN